MKTKHLPRPLSFHNYLNRRRYRSGRGSDEGWQFVARALGDPHLPNATSWKELHHYLRKGGEDERLIRAARCVWRSYMSRLVRIRAEQQELMPAWQPEASSRAVCEVER
jgi:hypothetical protein